ncbi:MAG TPA: hypothetical protein VH598_01285, partial [Verrucomicrobiae bacterium]|nr:hypothetical protein [Verrucomicrobiae bacterium]
MPNRHHWIRRVQTVQQTFFFLLLLLCLRAARAETTPSAVRRLSLKECIRIAMEHNLDLKVERYNSEIARYDLNLAYSYY